MGKDGLRRIDRISRELIREGLLVAKPTHYGLQVSLNPRQNDAIRMIITKSFPEFG